MTDEEGSVQTQGWSRRLDDNWSPSEEQATYAPPHVSTQQPPPPRPNDQLPSDTSDKTKRRWILVAAVAGLCALLLLGVIAGVLFTGGSSSKPTSASSNPTTPTTASAPPTSNTNDLVPVVQSFATDYATESAADKTYVAAFSSVTADLTSQDQRISQDTNTVQANEYGGGCSVADFSTYESCVSSEEQTANNANQDMTAAEAQIQTDYQQYASTASTYQSALSNFIGQVIALPWPSTYDSYVNAMVTAARAFRTDVTYQAAVTSSTPQSTVSTITAQAGTDVGNFNDAISALKAALLNGTQGSTS
jgi:hypothetical protein